MQYKKSKPIITLQPNDLVSDIFVVKFKKPVEHYKNGFKFELRVGDATGEIMLKYWGGTNQQAVQSIYDAISQDDVIHVTGKVHTWNEKLELSLNTEDIIKVLSKQEFDPASFLPASKRNIQEMYDELLDILKTIKDPYLKLVVEAFTSDTEFVEGFKHGAGSLYRHHAWIGGLLEHTLSVMRIADKIAQAQPTLGRDLLMVGAFLHDIGKIHEVTITTNIHMSRRGLLFGHIYMGAEMVSRKIKNLDIPNDYYEKIIHMILSHHGKQEWGAIKEPAFPEALALHQADNADGQVDGMIRVKSTANTEDEFMYSKDYGNVYLK